MIMTAHQVLDTYWNNTAPIDPFVIAQNIGITTLFMQLETNVLGLIKQNESQQIEIHINQHLEEETQRYTIAHELGHYFSVENFRYFKDDIYLIEMGLLNDTKNISDHYEEINANIFALELLMPKTAIDYMLKTGKANTIGDLAKIFKVSLSIMNVRLLRLGYVQ